MSIASFDPDLFAAMQSEATRQEEHIELIASENYTSPRVMEAQGSVLTNKYAEGYPHKRYYGAVSMSIGSRSWRSSAPRSCLGQPTPMCNRTPDPKPTRPFTWPCVSRAIPCWG